MTDNARPQVSSAAALQSAILNRAGFSCIATDPAGVIRIFNAGAERMFGRRRAQVVDKFTAAELFDPLRTPGFAALVFKASRGIEDTRELTCIHNTGSRFIAAVGVSALRDARSEIIGYLLRLRPAIGTPQAARPPASGLEQDLASLAPVEELLAGRTDVLLLRSADLSTGIGLARAGRPEVILLYIDQPGIDAVELIKLLRADPALQNTPVLALGPEAAPDVIVKALEAGFFHYLPAPLQPEALKQALAYALEFTAAQRAE